MITMHLPKATLLVLVLLAPACNDAPSSTGAASATAKPVSKEDCTKLTRAFELQGARMAQLGRNADITGSVDVYQQYASDLDLLSLRDGDLKTVFEEHRQHVKRAVEGGRKAADPATKSQGMSVFMVEAGKAGEAKRRIDTICADAR
jgi:hypothetical protein